MVGIGIVGIGFMGMVHYLAAQRMAEGRGKVVALCTRDRAKLAGDWTGIRGNFGPRGTRMDLSGLARHERFDDLLNDPKVQLVDLCVPNDQHAPMAIRALEAGKHVLVEKPIALETADADRMLDAARTAGRMLMVAHVLPYFPEFGYVREAVESGRFGRLLAAHFTRVISPPTWSDAIGDAERTGGPAIDLHIHDTHFIGLLCGAPEGVYARGVIERGAVVHLATQYLYPVADAPAVSALSGAITRKARAFAHGFEVYLERATLSLGIADMPGSGPVNPLSIITDESVEHPELGSGDPIDAFARELGDAVDAVDGGVEAPGLSARLARQALATCRAEVESVRTGREVALS
jgi:predicted dehydrogenase